MEKHPISEEVIEVLNKTYESVAEAIEVFGLRDAKACVHGTARSNFLRSHYLDPILKEHDLVLTKTRDSDTVLIDGVTVSVKDIVAWLGGVKSFFNVRSKTRKFSDLAEYFEDHPLVDGDKPEDLKLQEQILQVCAVPKADAGPGEKVKAELNHLDKLVKEYRKKIPGLGE